MSLLAAFDSAERVAAKPWFLVAFNVALATVWAWFGLDAANIMISIITAELVLIGLGAARRSQLGVHAKLDSLIKTSAADDALLRIEERQEHEIEEKRP